MRMPEELHGTGVVRHKHRLAKTIRGLIWIRFRRWTSLNPNLRDQFIQKLEDLLPIMYKGQCETCGWRGPCRHVQRMAENDALAHVFEVAPQSILRVLTDAREQLRLRFTNPEPMTTALPVVPHREGNDGDRRY